MGGPTGTLPALPQRRYPGRPVRVVASGVGPRKCKRDTTPATLARGEASRICVPQLHPPIDLPGSSATVPQAFIGN